MTERRPLVRVNGETRQLSAGDTLPADVIPPSDPGITLTFNFPLQLQWIVNHNLGRRPAVEVYTSGGALMFADVLHLNTNAVQITFDEPISGFVVIT